MSRTVTESVPVTDIVEDIATITTIPPASLRKLFDKVGWCICNAVEESRLRNEDITEINVGYGNLLISIENNQIQYKFIPNSKLEKGLVETIVNKKNSLVVNLEQTFANRIVKTYKDMF